ncbi:MAG: hypothetical protein QM500_13200 [Methylococcales bacterium]
MSSRDLDWKEELHAIAEKRGVSLIRFSQNEWSQLRQSRQGGQEFTIARAHEVFDGIKSRSLCLVLGDEEHQRFQLFIGVLSTKQAITTLDTRIKVRRLQAIVPEIESEFVNATGISSPADRSRTSVTRLTKKSGSAALLALSNYQVNEAALHLVLDAVRDVDPRAKNRSLQLDAVQTVLRIFDVEVNADAAYLEVTPEMDTALDGTNIQEANVILHDSRTVPGFLLESSDVTGRAIFVRGEEKLEVITANALPLEEVFGVDLIYLNCISKNIVMVQYKMLDKVSISGETRWQHRVTPQLTDEIARMNSFKADVFPGCEGYRLNSDPFYFKFVKRQRSEGTRGMVLPLEHFEELLASPLARGPNNGLRLDYEALSGQYLRQTAFIELVRSGYIGSKPNVSEAFERLIKYITGNGKSAVVVIRSLMDEEAG